MCHKMNFFALSREKLIDYMISEYRKLAKMVDFEYAQGYSEAIETIRKFDCEIMEEKS